MSEPRRWWIAPKLYSPADPVEAEFYIAYDQKGDPARLEIETVEASAYDKLAERLADAEKALLISDSDPQERTQEAAHYNFLEEQNEKLKQRLADAERALQAVKAKEGYCIYGSMETSHDPDEAFRQGSNYAFNELAELAREYFAKHKGDE